jgi:hypothetical protein
MHLRGDHTLSRREQARALNVSLTAMSRNRLLGAGTEQVDRRADARAKASPPQVYGPASSRGSPRPTYSHSLPYLASSVARSSRSISPLASKSQTEL